MPGADKSSRVTFIVLRHMRAPLMTLVAVYATSMVGWVLIPGTAQGGATEPLSFFHAFYFLTYTATTTGFGEIPHPFSEAQRMWSIVSLYAGVLAWLYAVGAIIRLLQNPHFQQALAERRFVKEVRRLHEPFVILCGFGSTGSLLARGLNDAGHAAVVIDHDLDRIRAVPLRDYRVPVPSLCADAAVPEHLIEAGLLRPNCRAVVALTGNEQVNLKVAVTTRLLNPGVQVICQSTSVTNELSLASLGADVHIVDPFQTFARYLATVIQAPFLHNLTQWLVGARGASLELVTELPRGHWVICGYGRMGHWLHRALTEVGSTTTVIDPGSDDDGSENMPHLLRGRADRDMLRAAGIERAVGLIAGVDVDADNLGIILNARDLNPGLFVLVRQNSHRNEMLFSAAHADYIMQPSLTSARRILFLLTAPLLKPLFETLRQRHLDSGGESSIAAAAQLRETLGEALPRLLTVHCDEANCTALAAAAAACTRVTVGDVLRDPAARERRIAAVALVLVSGESTHVLPGPDQELQLGDAVLFCGSDSALRLLDATLNNEYTLAYLVSGVDPVRGVLLCRLLGHRGVFGQRPASDPG